MLRRMHTTIPQITKKAAWIPAEISEPCLVTGLLLFKKAGREKREKAKKKGGRGENQHVIDKGKTQKIADGKENLG